MAGDRYECLCNLVWTSTFVTIIHHAILGALKTQYLDGLTACSDVIWEYWIVLVCEICLQLQTLCLQVQVIHQRESRVTAWVYIKCSLTVWVCGYEWSECLVFQPKGQPHIDLVMTPQKVCYFVHNFTIKYWSEIKTVRIDAKLIHTRVMWGGILNQ